MSQKINISSTIKHDIIERAIKNATPNSFNNSIYLRFCFLIDFFNITDFFERMEKMHPKRYSPEKIEYSSKGCINNYKKIFFWDCTRNNLNRISDTLRPFWDSFIEIITESDFKKTLGNSPQEILLSSFLRELNNNANFLETLILEHNSFIQYIGSEIIKYDDYRLSYFSELEYHDWMTEIYGDESSGDPIDPPERTLYEELYQKEIAKYSIYGDILYNCNSGLHIHTTIKVNSINDHSDSEFWNIVLENWDIFTLISQNDSVWCSYLLIHDPNITENKIDELFITMPSKLHVDFLQFTKNAEQYWSILSFNFSPPRRKNETIFKKLVNKTNNFTALLCYHFCSRNRATIQNFDKNSITLLFRLFISQNL